MKIGFTVDTNLIEGRYAKATSLIKALSYYVDYIKMQNKINQENK